MTAVRKQDLVKQVILGARNYGINTVLFRHAAGEALGVNVTDMECLALVFHQGYATPSELSRQTGLSSGATTAMLDRLERASLIQRQPNPDDRRSIHIVIEKGGVERLAPMFNSVRRAQEELVASYSEEELALLVEFFVKSSAMWQAERTDLLQTMKDEE